MAMAAMAIAAVPRLSLRDMYREVPSLRLLNLQLRAG